jgi:hypothetical protein
VDPKFQAEAWLLRLDHAPPWLRPGTAVTAYLEMAGEPTEGVAIPSAAVVYLMGSAWI